MDKPNNIVQIPDAHSIYAEASEWLVLIEDGELSPDDKAEFEAWISKSEKHREAFSQRADLWQQFDQISVLNDLGVSDEVVNLLKKDSKPILGRFGNAYSYAAGLAAMIAIFVGLWLFQVQGDTPKQSLALQTAIGEQITFELPDKTVVNLNTDSELRTEFTEQNRIVHLIRGEAYFDVEPDKTRPFSVVAGAHTVTAVGTAFTVHRKHSATDVIVTHGKVALYSKQNALESDPEPKNSASTIDKPSKSKLLAELSAGQSAALEADEPVQIKAVEAQTMLQQLSWRDGLLSFSGEPLLDVINDISRYTAISIEIDDKESANLPVSGYIKIGQYEEMFEALEIMAGLETVRVSPTRIRLVKK